MPVVHCDRRCLHNMNTADLCDFGPEVRLYWVNGICNKHYPRPLPLPPPIISNLIHDKINPQKAKRTKHGKVWR
jgi:hypothetical protein